MKDSKVRRMIARYRARGLWEPIGLHDRALPGAVVDGRTVCGDADRCCEHPRCRGRCNLARGCGRGCKATAVCDDCRGKGCGTCDAEGIVSVPEF